MFSPGMVAGVPAAAIVICIDWDLAGYDAPIPSHREVYWDVGSAAQNMLLAAHALGLVAGPMTADSPSALRIFLNLPPNLDPQLIVGVGHRAEPPPPMPHPSGSAPPGSKTWCSSRRSHTIRWRTG